MVRALADPDHPERDELLEWLDEDFDPLAFEQDEVNAGFGKLKL